MRRVNTLYLGTVVWLGEGKGLEFTLLKNLTALVLFLWNVHLNKMLPETGFIGKGTVNMASYKPFTP